MFDDFTKLSQIGSAILNISGGTPTYTEDWGGLNPQALCAGLVNVSVTDSNGCIATNFVTINDPPAVVVNISQNGDTLDAGIGFASYQWLDANLSPISGATSQFFMPINTGEYYVTVTDANGCTATSLPFMYIIEGISTQKIKFNIYPNPTKDILNIDYEGFKINSVTLIDMYGKVILQKDKNNKGEDFRRISLNHLPKGMYLLQIYTDEKVINNSVILQ